jgi:hypothetical protein
MQTEFPHYESTLSGIPRYVENPEYRKERLRREIEQISLNINSHEERIIELRELKKSKEKDLKEESPG